MRGPYTGGSKSDTDPKETGVRRTLIGQLEKAAVRKQ